MNKRYTFTYRRLNCTHCENNNSFFATKSKICDLEWKNIKVIGHGPETIDDTIEEIINGTSTIKKIRKNNNNKMVLYKEDGSLEVIAKWSECEVRLGVDWVLATKAKMEEQIGRDIKLSVDA